MKQPDSGRRTPDPGPRTPDSGTVTATETETVTVTERSSTRSCALCERSEPSEQETPQREQGVAGHRVSFRMIFGRDKWKERPERQEVTCTC